MMLAKLFPGQRAVVGWGHGLAWWQRGRRAGGVYVLCCKCVYVDRRRGAKVDACAR